MPGVPSSRGCDACRKQKKKCDQAKPACGRCARLQIGCSGGGQQRYKFHNQTVVHPPGRRRTPGSHSSSPGPESGSASGPSPTAQDPPATPRALVLFSSPPANAQSAVAGRLVSALEIRDPRFDLSVYGSFLRDIPRRVGSSPALDAAAAALAATLPLVVRHTDSDGSAFPAARPTVSMLHHYGRALQTLRTSLYDPTAAAAPNTLCALYLVVVCQGWLQHEEGHFPSHGEAVATILRSMKGRVPLSSGFEQNVMSTLCFLVIMESFVNPRIQVDDDLWHVPEPCGPTSVTDEPLNIESLSNHILARIARLLRAPKAHRRELAEAYGRVRIDRAKLATLLASIPVVPSADGRLVAPVSEAICYVHLRWQAGFAMLTLVAMRIAAVLIATQPSASNDSSFPTATLTGHFQAYINDVADVAEQALQYYPLGSSCMPLCLLVAYTALGVATSDTSQRRRINRLFSEYRPGIDLDKQLSSVMQALEPKGVSPRPAISCSDGEVETAISRADTCCIL